MIYRYHKAKQEREEFDNGIYPSEIAVNTAKDRRLTWGSDIEDDLGSRNGDVFSGKNHPWTTKEKVSSSDITNPANNYFDGVAVATSTAFIPSKPKSIPKTSPKSIPKTPPKPISKSLQNPIATKLPPKPTPPQNKKECFAPPGKLGVAIDTLNGVPVVHRVKSGSPLEGILLHKDRIIGIDEVDCTNMSAADVTKVMVSRMNKTRKISYVRCK